MHKVYGEKNLEIIGSKKHHYLEKNRTKRDAFILMDCDTPEYTEQYQCYAVFLVVKKTSNTVRVLKEWLKYAQNYNIITDAPNVCGKQNYEGVVEHRFDQSILSLLMTKYHVKMVEQLPIPEFHIYHHSKEITMKAVKKRMRSEERRQIYDFLKKRDMKGIWDIQKEKMLHNIFIQRIYKGVKYKHVD